MNRLALISLVLMSALASVPMSALARTTLTSPDLGWFFTLPSDYPTEVSSYDTPGSCDWYIAQPTTTTTTNYVARSPRLTPSILAGLNSTFEAYYERLYYGSQGSDNSWNSAIYGPTSRRYFYWNIVPLFGPWTIMRSLRFDFGHEEDVTDSVRQPEYLDPDYETGRWRAYATDEDMSKSGAYIDGPDANSKYAALLSYSARWTNSYSELEWANYTARRAITNSVPDYAALRNFSYQPTTHEVSRRLLDFDNYASLWQNLRYWADEYINQYDDTKSFIYRPHWLNTDGDHAYWSSTILTDSYGFFDFPAFGWTQNPVESFDHPTYTAPVFDNFENDGYCKHTGPAGVSIPRSVFYNIYVDNSIWHWEDFDYGASCGNLLYHLDYHFPELDHYYMPSLTRRLSFNDLCFINQYLSLFDRTYDIPQFNGFERYLSTTRHHEKTEVASVSAPAFRAADGTWFAEISPDSLSWGAGNERTYDVPSTNSYGQARMATRVDSSTTGGRVSIEAQGNAGSIYASDIMSDLNAPYDATLCFISSAALGEYGVVVSVIFYKGEEVLESVERTLGSASAWNRATLNGTGTTLIDRSFYKQWTPLALDDEFNYSLSPHAPGPEAYQTERIADATTWFVEADHHYVYTNQTFQSISNPLVYRGSDSSLRYRSVAADVTSRDVNHALNDELRSLAETLAEEDPDLSIDDSWFDEVRSNRYSAGETCGAQAYLFASNGIWLNLQGRQVLSAFYYDETTGEKIDLHPTTPIISISVHYSYSAGGSPYPGSVVESTPKNADIYIQPLTRVDWDWKALKRSSTSN